MEICENLIYDVGMHRGKDTEFYLKKGFKVVAIEANPELLDSAKTKFSDELIGGRLIIIDKAISDKKGLIDFYINKDKDDWGSINPDWNTGPETRLKKIYVESIPLEEIIVQHGMPYYLKVDIEGADILCLKSLLHFAQKPPFISCELLSPHNYNTDKIDCLDILSYLKVLGYTKFYASNQKRNNEIKCPYPSKEGKYIDYHFDEECSGLFGRELEGEWAGFDFFAYHYLCYFHEYAGLNKSDYLRRLLNKYVKTHLKEKALFPKYGWFDVHATF